MACRQHGIPLGEEQELFQEFVTRLVSDSGFGPDIRRLLEEAQQDPALHGNLAFRYLVSRAICSPSARFRTVLKAVIRNVILEASRIRRRFPQAQPQEELERRGAWIEHSVDTWLDRQWAADRIVSAMRDFCQACRVAPTRARRRLFEVLYWASKPGESATSVAQRYGLDPSTIADNIRDARLQLADHLQRATGIRNYDELASLLRRYADVLSNALDTVYREATGQGPDEA